MKFILNADDFGISEDTVEATIELFEKKELSSATIILSMPGTDQAIKYARKHPEFSFGLHLNIVTDTFERPLLNPKLLPSLTTSDGFFHNSKYLRKMLFFRKVNQDEIAKEALAQINFLKNNDVNISHIDSHGHMHKFPIFLETLYSIKSKTNINRIRNTQNIFIENIKNKFLRPSFLLKNYFENLIKKKFKTTDLFFNNLDYEDYLWPEKILKIKGNISKTIEVGIHPGKVEKWRRNETLNTKKLADLIKNSKSNSLINWNNI